MGGTKGSRTAQLRIQERTKILRNLAVIASDPTFSAAIRVKAASLWHEMMSSGDVGRPKTSPTETPTDLSALSLEELLELEGHEPDAQEPRTAGPGPGPAPPSDEPLGKALPGVPHIETQAPHTESQFPEPQQQVAHILGGTQEVAHIQVGAVVSGTQGRRHTE